jgi:hypothetical protein
MSFFDSKVGRDSLEVLEQGQNFLMSSGDAIFQGIGKVLGDIVERIPKQNSTGTNTLSNVARLKCPRCEEVGRWIRYDE